MLAYTWLKMHAFTSHDACMYDVSYRCVCEFYFRDTDMSSLLKFVSGVSSNGLALLSVTFHFTCYIDVKLFVDRLSSTIELLVFF